MDVMQRKEACARVGNATVAIRQGCSHREIIQPRCMMQRPRRPGELPGVVTVHSSHAERCTQQHAARLLCPSVTNVSYRRHAKASQCIRVIAETGQVLLATVDVGGLPAVVRPKQKVTLKVMCRLVR